ncbi:MAG: amidohydrolase [Sutterella sp.]
MSSEQLFVNGRIFTGLADDAPLCDAMRVKDGRIVWIGRQDGVPDGAVDLQGRTVIPALCDAHTHPSWVAETVSAAACVSPAVNSIPEMIEALKAHPACGRDDGSWITGWGYDEGKLAERRTPTRHDLDLVSRTQPVFVRRSDCHSAICNTRALELASITRETPDPAGGRYGRDPDGTPNGVLTEFSAASTVQRVMTKPTFENEVKALAATAEHYLSRGITTMTEMMASRHLLDVYREAVRRGFPIRAGLYLIWTGGSNPEGMPELTDEEKTGEAFVAGIKLFGDGSVSGRTAWVTMPYKDSTYGFGTLPDDDLAAAAAYARRNGVQLSVHAMGDRSIEQVIAYFEHQTPWLADRPSVRIEHVTFLTEAQTARMAASPMNFGITTQVIFPYAEVEGYEAALTPEAYARIYPLRMFWRTVPALAVSSDAPATAWADPDNPFTSMMAAVTRTAFDGTPFVPEEAVTRTQALMLYTGRAMGVLPFEGSGTLTPGSRADFAVLSDDFFSVPAEDIGRIRVVETRIAGRTVWQERA